MINKKMKVSTNFQRIKELLNRGVAEIIERSHLEKKLRSGKRLRVKLGIDPTAPYLHLGHSIVLRKLRQFQELGHQIVFLIGDFTAQIGDPSARLNKRRPLTPEEVKKNMATYKAQAGKILDIKKVEIRYNSEWYKKKDSSFFLDLTSRFTFARLIERDDFQERIKKNIEITMLELIYPILQGYDSVVLKADVEIGGTDQKFNLLFARRVQKKYGQIPEDIITVPLLIGTDGVRKMSQSFGNYIKLTENPNSMFGQIMSIPDTLIWHYFELLTNLPKREIKTLKEKVEHFQITPKDAKSRLAKEIVAFYYGKKQASRAEKEFERVFKKGELPTEISKVKVFKKPFNILDLLLKTKLALSKSEAKRLVLQGGVKIDGLVQKDWKKTIKVKKGMIIQVGKRRFVKVI